ncbi:MAG: ribose 5-phosphate isomerase B [Pirellulaceae bacterium]
MKIYVGSDHRGVSIKARIVATLESLGFEVTDVGTHGDLSVDYPDFARVVCEAIGNGDADRGMLICGTGIGMAIAANKYQGVRAANCYDEVMAEMCRRHNDVNVLCLPGDLIGERPVDDLVRIWLNTDFEGGRHARRLEKIQAIEHANPKMN